MEKINSQIWWYPSLKRNEAPISGDKERGNFTASSDHLKLEPENTRVLPSSGNSRGAAETLQWRHICSSHGHRQPQNPGDFSTAMMTPGHLWVVPKHSLWESSHSNYYLCQTTFSVNILSNRIHYRIFTHISLFKFFLVLPKMYMVLYVWIIHVCVVCLCSRRPEVGDGCLPQSPPLPFEIGLLTKSEAHRFG